MAKLKMLVEIEKELIDEELKGFNVDEIGNMKADEFYKELCRSNIQDVVGCDGFNIKKLETEIV